MEYSTFECASGDEIPLSSVNDGADDCPAGDDEPSYGPVTKAMSTYTCLYSGETIALSLVNDGVEAIVNGTMNRTWATKTSTNGVRRLGHHPHRMGQRRR